MSRIRRWIQKDKEFTDRILTKHQQLMLYLILIIMGGAVLVCYILYNEGML